MGKRISHPHADEIARLIENLARWPGWHGGHSSRSSIGWVMDFVANRRQGEFGPSIPVLGGEAEDTMAAMRRMPFRLAQVLEVYYTIAGDEEKKLKFLNRRRRSSARIGPRTFRLHVSRAHDDFWEQYTMVRESARRAGESNRALNPGIEAAVPIVPVPRIVPRNTRWVLVPRDGGARSNGPQTQYPCGLNENGK